MDLPDGIATWQQFRSEYAKLNPKSKMTVVSEAWSRYKEEGRAGKSSTKRSTKRTPKKTSPKKPSIKRTQKKISPKKSPKHAKKTSPKKTSPKVVREPSTELIPVSATLTGLPTELGMKISGYAGKETARSMQIASKRTAEFSLVELKKLCESEPTTQEYIDAITRRKEPTSFYTSDVTPLLIRLGELPQHYESRYRIVYQGKNINIQGTIISVTPTGTFQFTDKLLTMRRRQDVLMKLTPKDIPRLVNDLEAKQVHIHHKIVARTHPAVYDLNTVRKVYKRRLSCVETADNYITERLRAYIVRSYESIVDDMNKIDGKVVSTIDSKAVLSRNYESIETAVSLQPRYKVNNYLVRLITLTATLAGINAVGVVSSVNVTSPNGIHKHLLGTLCNYYDRV